MIGAFLAVVAGGSMALGQEATQETTPATQEATSPTQDAQGTSSPQKVMVIPVQGQIGKPTLFVLRRGIKEAITKEVDLLVLDMNTPGGSLGVTLEIMEVLDRFPNKVITHVNGDATSAGAIIAAVTDEIYLSKRATIGSSEAVTATGGELSPAMKRKLNSYMAAKIEAYNEDRPLRAQVLKAMLDAQFEFKVDEEVISPKGELLNLTAKRAMEEFGDPPIPLLGAGIAENVSLLLNGKLGEGNYSVERYEPTWSEDFAQWITALTPVLIALGLLGLFVEFKTPGFGVFGVAGLILLGIVFFGHHTAGLSGHEPMLLLLIGLILIAVEIFIIPGTMVSGILGAVLVLSSLVWAMLDIWPNEPLTFDGDLLTRPLINVTLGVAGAVILFIALLRFLPGSGPWGGMVLQTAIAGAPDGIHPVHAPEESGMAQADLVGSKAVAATDLYPSGQVTIKGKRYEARLEVGSVDAGADLKVTRVSEFGLIVEPQSKEAKS